MVFTVIAGFSDWNSAYLAAPSNAYDGTTGQIIMGITTATKFGIYDMTGYYDVCFIGGEVENPKVNVPKSCVATCGVVGVIYLLVYVAVLGHLNWVDFVDMYSEGFEGASIGIMSTFTESVTGSVFLAYCMTLIVGATIFGSVFSMMCGFSFVLYTAASDGYFYEFFAHKHETIENLPDRALVTISFLSALWCFFSIDVVIEAMTVMLVLVQFSGQSFGLMYWKWVTPAAEQIEGWKMPLYPLPCLIQFILFMIIFWTSPSLILYGDTPILEMAISFIIFGIGMFCLRSKMRKEWPFQPRVPHEFICKNCQRIFSIKEKEEQSVISDENSQFINESIDLDDISLVSETQNSQFISEREKMSKTTALTTETRDTGVAESVKAMEADFLFHSRKE
jgi:amino acid transporter